MTPAPPLRRIGAFLVDYAVMAAWLAALTAASFASGFAETGFSLDTLGGRLQAHGLAFATVTAPIVVGFAALEASSLRGTLGKRALGLEVVRRDGAPAGFGRTLIRNAGKFLPWEIAHAGIWYMPGRPFVDEPAVWNLALQALALALAAVYAASIVVGARRTPYDRAAGLAVARRDAGGAVPG
jgi:uncharacterized RDD family membrane protein YckC